MGPNAILDAGAVENVAQSAALPQPNADLVAWLRKASSAIYLATEASVADDISPKLREAANALEASAGRVAELERERDELEFLLNEGGSWEAQLKASEAELKSAEEEAQKLREALEKIKGGHIDNGADMVLSGNWRGLFNAAQVIARAALGGQS